jgi:pimeloyl-ACP methyl ester carboxylesterase
MNEEDLMAQLRSDDALLAYAEYGAGAPLVLIHAFPLHGGMWAQQVAALASRARVIVLDMRGFGGSELGAAAPTMERYADDVVALLDHLGLQRAVIGGLSMGGYVAFALLRRYAERVSGLLLANTRALPDTEAARAARAANAQIAETQGPEAIAEQMLPRLLSDSATPDVRRLVRDMILSNRGDGIAAALRAMAQRADSSDLLGGIAAPTLVIGAGADPLIPLDETRAMQAAISGSRLLELGGVGHLSNLEAPDQFNTALAELLAAAG